MNRLFLYVVQRRLLVGPHADANTSDMEKGLDVADELKNAQAIDSVIFRDGFLHKAALKFALDR